MLAEYTWNGRPLIDQVEPKPLTMAGNYLVFRAPVDPTETSGVSTNGQQKSWGELLEDRAIKIGKQSADERLIPLPTAGVFAEAVLGRSNSAEKLDITRFWNWQDSPIPITPTEIAPVGTGSRAMSEELKPGQLGQPVLNIVNPQNLPNPAGLGAAFGALATPNMFRDMSGLAGTQNLVQSGMQETLQAATDAGQITSANLRTEAQKSVAMAQVAADIVKSVMGGGGSSSASQSVSGAGAMINHGKSMDKANAGAVATGGGGLGAAANADVGDGSSGGGSASPAQGSFSAAPSSENQQAAFQHALYGNLGASGVDAAQASLAAANGAQATSVGAVAGGSEIDPLFQRVSDTVLAPQAYKQLVGLIGELLIERSLTKQGHTVFRQPYKSVSANGVDLVSLAPNGEVWLIDNKAWMRGINGADALTGQQAIGNFRDVLDFLERWPSSSKSKVQAELAIKALKTGSFRQVVSNAFAGETTRFTKTLFAKTLWVYDMRLQNVFSNYATWEAAYKTLTLRRGMRLTGVRGSAIVDGVLLVLAASVAAGGAAFLFRADAQAKALASSVAADIASGLLVEQLSTKLFGISAGPAGIAVVLSALESDESPEQRAARKRDELLVELIPDFYNLSKVDQDASRQALKDLLIEPIDITPKGYPAPAGPYNPPSPPPPSINI
jgi:hypothetical protein